MPSPGEDNRSKYTLSSFLSFPLELDEVYEELGAALEGLEGNEPQGPRTAALTRLARGILKVGMRRCRNGTEVRNSAARDGLRGGNDG